MKKNKSIINFKSLIHHFQGGQIQPGNYAVQFQFNLPKDLPSTLKFKDEGAREKPKAKISYKIKASLDNCDCGDIYYKLKLMVRQSIGQTEPETKKINTNVQGCCWSENPSQLKIGFGKSVYDQHEMAEFEVEIDNSQCGVDCSYIRAKVSQRFEIHIGGHTYSRVFDIIGGNTKGPKANQEGISKHNIQLALKDVRPPY